MTGLTGLTAVDLFAGLGGWTEAAGQLGIRVVWTANHWQLAVDFHKRNHPEAEHVCQDLNQANWGRVPRHNVLLASPCCQGHSRARGAEGPHHDESRSTAWAVIGCAEWHRPRLVIVENVPEFAKWCLYGVWRRALETLGYGVTETVVNCAECGVAQERRRLFVVGCLDGAITLGRGADRGAPARELVDWEGGRWSRVHRDGRAEATLRRWERGREEHGERFVMSYYGQSRGGGSIERPIGTITPRARWAVVCGDWMRMLTVDEARRAMSFRDGYELPENGRLAMHLLGNAVPPVAGRWVLSRAVEGLI